MRRFIVTSAALCAFGFAGAEHATAQQNMVGVKGGFVAADLSGDDVGDEISSRTGFGFGGFLQVMVAPGWSIQPEALFIMKGAEDADDDKIELNYLQVPVLVQYHVPAVGISPRIFAGPSIAFELSCDFDFGDASESCEDQGIETKSADFGLVFGAGVDIPAGGVIVTVDGRYDLGLTKIDDSVDEDDVKNRSWELFAGIGFPFGP